jgi:ArsR family transcriptional regulator
LNEERWLEIKGNKQVSKIMKVLAHPVRLQILEILIEEDEACVCHMEMRLKLRQAYISQHLAKLREVGLVEDRREGLNVFYAMALSSMESLLKEARQLAVEVARVQGIELSFNPIQKVSPQLCICPKCNEKSGLAIEKGSIAEPGSQIDQG